MGEGEVRATLLQSVVFLYVSIINSGEAREHRDDISVPPICLNKEVMGWGSLTSHDASGGVDGDGPLLDWLWTHGFGPGS